MIDDTGDSDDSGGFGKGLLVVAKTELEMLVCSRRQLRHRTEIFVACCTVIHGLKRFGDIFAFVLIFEHASKIVSVDDSKIDDKDVAGAQPDWSREMPKLP